MTLAFVRQAVAYIFGGLTMIRRQRAIMAKLLCSSLLAIVWSSTMVSVSFAREPKTASKPTKSLPSDPEGILNMDIDQLSKVDVRTPAMNIEVSSVTKQESTVGRSAAAFRFGRLFAHVDQIGAGKRVVHIAGRQPEKSSAVRLALGSVRRLAIRLGFAVCGQLARPERTELHHDGHALGLAASKEIGVRRDRPEPFGQPPLGIRRIATDFSSTARKSVGAFAEA